MSCQSKLTIIVDADKRRQKYNLLGVMMNGWMNDWLTADILDVAGCWNSSVLVLTVASPLHFGFSCLRSCLIGHIFQTSRTSTSTSTWLNQCNSPSIEEVFYVGSRIWINEIVWEHSRSFYACTYSQAILRKWMKVLLWVVLLGCVQKYSSY